MWFHIIFLLEEETIQFLIAYSVSMRITVHFTIFYCITNYTLWLIALISRLLKIYSFTLSIQRAILFLPPGMNCRQYQDDLKARSSNDQAANQTQMMIRKMLDDGEAMNCPKCKVKLFVLHLVWFSLKECIKEWFVDLVIVIKLICAMQLWTDWFIFRNNCHNNIMKEICQCLNLVFYCCSNLEFWSCEN